MWKNYRTSLRSVASSLAMKMPGFVSLILATLLACAPFAPAQDAPLAPPAPEASLLESLPARLQKGDDEGGGKLAEVRAVVDAEAAAKRISEPMVQSLRWSLRTTATAGAVVDV